MREKWFFSYLPNKTAENLEDLLQEDHTIVGVRLTFPNGCPVCVRENTPRQASLEVIRNDEQQEETT